MRPPTPAGGLAPGPAPLGDALAAVGDGLRDGTPTDLHCWGGHGRTGTVVACRLIREGHSADEAIDALLGLRADCPKNHHPFDGGQEAFVRAWADAERDRRG